MELEKKIIQWHHDRNLIHGTTDRNQFIKLAEEVKELYGNICAGTDIRDDIGDIIVVLINIAERNGYSLDECVQVAYDDIKDRTGKMIGGVYVKDA